jgi:hypothetical protein
LGLALSQLLQNAGHPIRPALVLLAGLTILLAVCAVITTVTPGLISFPLQSGLPQGSETRVKVGLCFYDSPRVTTDAQQKVKFLELARLVP